MREEGPSLDRSNQLILGITNRNEQQTAVQLIHVTKKKGCQSQSLPSTPLVSLMRKFLINIRLRQQFS
jgi:hypothetical protein